MSTDSEFRLTDEQQLVIGAPISQRVVVLAAAGSGKTEVVARRLAILLERDEITPGSELLVLSFSNAAVGDLRRRMKGVDARLAAARLSTFDSFAARLLFQYAEPGAMEQSSFDERIRRCRDLLSSSADAKEDMAAYRHVVIDELQDLVGDRAELVKALLTAIPVTAGYTLLGDPAQGVYEFQLKKSKSKQTARQLLRWVLDRDPQPLVLTLSGNHRARTKAAELASECGQRIRDHATSGGHPMDDFGVGSLLLMVHEYEGALAARLAAARAADGDTVGVLCRDNGQLLQLSRLMFERGVAHRIQPAAGDSPVSAWLGRALRGWDFATMSKATFLQRAAASGAIDPEGGWRGVKRLEADRSPDLNLRVLGSRLVTTRPPDEVLDPPIERVVLSSVHRAKGLEWDYVFLYGLTPRGEDPFEEARVIYVAMSRARQNVFAIKGLDAKLYRAHDLWPDRWYRQDRHRNLVQVEVLAEDVENWEPISDSQNQLSAREVQNYLDTHVSNGDAVDLVLERSIIAGEPIAHYRVDHRHTAIGKTTRTLSDALLRLNSTSGRPFPQRLVGARVMAIETVAGGSAAGFRANLGSSGIWLRPRIFGVADVMAEVRGA